ncbi:MAG: hypothetical protein C0476_04090 [Sphingomonas sp.]|nr:hypothetical protein [Sphingomonas sp.]
MADPGRDAVSSYGAATPSRWSTVGGTLLTLAMLLGLTRALFGGGLAGFSQALPRDPWFYIASIALYLTVPVGDFVIFRRLWRLPAAGFAALLKKGIANEVVLGYAGEVYFYTWARARAQMIAAPFGAVKDVSILSALAGNVVTLLLVVLALPFAYRAVPPELGSSLMWSVGVVIATSLPFLIFARRVFSLPQGVRWWIFAAHMARLGAAALLVAIVWRLGLPELGLGSLIILSAGRMLVGRLPLVPNKDLLFANFTVLLVGQDAGVSAVVAITAAFTLVLHLLLTLVFGLHALMRKF